MQTEAQPPSPGDVLPELGIDITAKLIVGGAIASRDYQDVHHDKTAAQALGSPDLFMNILTTNGLVGRYVTDWAGPGARLKKLAIGLGAPNFPGDHMILSGRVASVDNEASVVEVEIRGANSLGDHVTGRVSVQWPRC
jgi:hypothetical protein